MPSVHFSSWTGWFLHDILFIHMDSRTNVSVDFMLCKRLFGYDNDFP